MDRTEASDAFNAGSIPVGCIIYGVFMSNKDFKDRTSLKEKLHRLSTVMQDYFMLFKEWASDYGKVIMPIMLLLLVSVTVLISLNAREKVDEAAKEALEILEETKADVQEVKETLFEEDAYPELNELMLNYYEALEMADVDTLVDLQSSVTNTEIIRLQKMSEYISSYENIAVYSKPGPYVDTFIAYVYSEVHLKDREEYAPGLQAFYVCKNENGNLYINTSELSDEEAAYIKQISEQEDVVELKTSVNVSYKNILESNNDFNEYWTNLSIQIDTAVQDQLALEAQLTAQLNEEMNKEEVPEVETDEPVIERVKTTSAVNVRKSASQTADKLGSAALGDVFVVEETMSNGWTKINFNGKDGYIKSEYLIKLENVDNIAAIGSVVSTTTLNVRAEASMTAEKIGVLTEGQAVPLVSEEDGWCKIKFDGQIGYVKSDYVK